MAVKWTAEQQKVIDTRDRNLLVSAAAGSGKTAVLVERILAMVKDPVRPIDVDQLLVVTFTRAAAGEMKERIGRALQQSLEEDPENEHLQRQQTLLHHAQISTIHGFCSYVIKNYFQMIDLDPVYRMADEGEIRLMKSDVIQKVMEERFTQKEPAFTRFVESYAAGKQDDGLDALVLKLYEFSMSYPWPEQWLEECRAAYQMDSPEAVQESIWVQELMSEAKKRLSSILEGIQENRKTAVSPGGPYLYDEALASDQQMLEELLETESFDELVRAMAGMKFKALSRKKADDVSEALKDQVKAERDVCKKELQKLKEQFFEKDSAEIAEEIADCREPIGVLIDLTEQFAKAFAEKKRSKNILDYADLEHFALEILVQQEDGRLVRTDAARELSEQFREIMIDEYQDSNLIQEAILTSVSGCRSGRYNIFMVGDVKQSIYRFRLSRPELFLEKFRTYNIEESKTQRIDLHKNFRSRKEVLESANAIFRQIMTEKLGGIVYDDQAALYPGAEYPENDNVKTEILVMNSDLEILSKEEDFEEKIPSERELEARMIAMRIRELLRSQKVTDKETGELRNVRYSDIVILTRSIKGFADVFTEVLNREGIPTYAGTSEGYFQTQEIGVLMDYLRVLDNRRQDIPLTAVLSSAFAGLSQEELAEIRCAYPDTAFFESVTKYREQGENADIQLKLQKCLDQMDDFRKIVPYTPMHELLWKILETTGYGDYVASMPGGAQRKANLDMLIEKARAYESTSYKGLFHFVRYIEQLQKYDVDYGEASIEDEHADTVRVMTIHKSKGLEFPVVIVAGMGKRFNMQDARSAVALHAGMGVGLDAVNLEYRTKIPSIIKKVIQKEEALESLGEELRVLYVALTRAKEKLIITGTLSNPEDKISDGRVFQGNKRKELSFLQLSHAVTYWDFILPAVLRTEGEPLKLQILHVEDVVKESIEEEEKSGISRAVLENWDVNEIYEPKLHDMMKEQFEFIYPYEKSSMRKLKFTVTELKKRAYEIGLDGGEEEREEEGELLQEEPEVVPMIPQFLQEDEVLAGAARGTAYHRVMELLDMKGMPEFTEDTAGEKENWKKYFMDWLDDQVRRGRIEEDAARCICWEDILQFAKSGIGRRLREADGKQRLWREQPFVLGIDARELYPEEEDGELILVQGIIDAYFEEPDGLVVLDYKTDKIRRKEELAERYQEQLRYYAKALEQMTGKKVKEKIIYSFTLKEGIYLNK